MTTAAREINMDETVDCVAGDKECGRRAGEEQPSGGSATAK